MITRRRKKVRLGIPACNGAAREGSQGRWLGGLLCLAGVCVVAALWLWGCKEQINPHVAAEADPEVLVASLSAASTVQKQDGVKPTTGERPRKVVLTLNNAPAPNELFELEITQKLVELFEQRNPDVQIEFSTWRFTPESFYERARSHTLTDVVEVTLDQMQPIMDLSLAADMTSILANTPEIQSMNPAVLALTSREGRLFGVPLELQTMAIFYNRRMLEACFNPKPQKENKPQGKQSAEKKSAKGGGVDGNSLEAWEAASSPTPAPFLLAQARRYGSSYYDYFGPNRQDGQQEDDFYSRRGEQQVENEYQVTPRPRFRWPFRPINPLRTPAQPSSRPSFWRRLEPQPVEQPLEDQSEQGLQGEQAPRGEIESARPTAQQGTQGVGQQTGEEIESARPQATAPKAGEARTTQSAAAKEELSATVVKEELTTALTLPRWARNWEEFIKLAVKLTDHEKGVYGYAPVLFANQGGREFVQWAVLAGLDASKLPVPEALAALRGQAGLDSLEFLKNLRWRYDVMPPAERCYGDNVLQMFAQGKIAMIMLPATKDSIRRLMRAGMAPDNIGIAPLPHGPVAPYHLTFGRCVIVNSQADQAKRQAAAKWIRFLIDPESARIREQYLFREQDLTGIPHVPLYNRAKQDQFYAMLKSYRLLPVFVEYEDTVTTALMPEPARLRDELYADTAKDVRAVVELRESVPATAAANLARDFEKRYLRSQAATEKPSLDYYLRLFALPQK
ncbi:MAG: extracellular solute-binding protein [Candidatus Sumerlaeaceae bacterium]